MSVDIYVYCFLLLLYQVIYLPSILTYLLILILLLCFFISGLSYMIATAGSKPEKVEYYELPGKKANSRYKEMTEGT